MVFGLGNPGRKYQRTRHNLGFMVLDRLAQDFRARFRGSGDWQQAHIQIGGCRCDFVKPMLYMNNSGAAVKDYRDKRRGEFLVVFDDIDLPFGRIRIRERGSDGGHQGMADIIRELETTDFPRVRMGIGIRPAGVDAADYVLSRFSPEEEELLDAVVEAGRDAVVTIVEQGISTAMNRFNALNLVGDEGAEPEAAGEVQSSKSKVQTNA